MLVTLAKGDFCWKAADINNGRFKVLCQEQVQFYDNLTKTA
jgi:hypothetical protein